MWSVLFIAKVPGPRIIVGIEFVLINTCQVGQWEQWKAMVFRTVIFVWAYPTWNGRREPCHPTMSELGPVAFENEEANGSPALQQHTDQGEMGQALLPYLNPGTISKLEGSIENFDLNTSPFFTSYLTRLCPLSTYNREILLKGDKEFSLKRGNAARE